MSLKEQLQNTLKDAMRANDDLRKRTLRMAISAIRLAEIDRGAELDDNAVIAILQKEVKSRQEAIEEAHQAGRPELADAAQEEIDVLKVFLPEQLSPDELDEMARQVVLELGATSMREMGQVMKALVPRLEGRATGQQANQAVRKLLT